MVWNIYSIGDSYYLQRVLNAVAMVCGTSDFESACAIALLLSVLIIAFQTVIRQTGINIQNSIICYLFWFASYYPSVTVNIHDVYTQQDRPVDNVPLGPAAIGSIVSTVGFKLTEIMETAFQDPQSTNSITGGGAGEGGRFGNALYMLNSISQAGVNHELTIPMEMNSGDWTGSMENYVRDCTFKALQIGPKYGGKTEEDIYKKPIDEALMGVNEDLCKLDLNDVI